MIFTRNIQQMLADLVKNDVLIVTGSGAPTNGTSGTGAGLTGPGSLYLRSGNGTLFINSNTKASPTWTAIT